MSLEIDVVRWTMPPLAVPVVPSHDPAVVVRRYTPVERSRDFTVLCDETEWGLVVDFHHRKGLPVVVQFRKGGFSVSAKVRIESYQRQPYDTSTDGGVFQETRWGLLLSVVPFDDAPLVFATEEVLARHD